MIELCVAVGTMGFTLTGIYYALCPRSSRK